MNPQFKHKLGSSLAFFLEHKVLNKGQAYTNVSGDLYDSDQIPFNGFTFSSSPDAQWVYDSSVSGAIIPSGMNHTEVISGVTVNTFTSRESGVNLNFLNGLSRHLRELLVYKLNSNDKLSDHGNELSKRYIEHSKNIYDQDLILMIEIINETLINYQIKPILVYLFARN